MSNENNYKYINNSYNYLVNNVILRIKNMKLSKTSCVVIIYIIGVILGAFFLDIWGAETNIKKGFTALGWTALFLIAIFFVDKDKEE